jgi:hypothetical protein
VKHAALILLAAALVGCGSVGASVGASAIASDDSVYLLTGVGPNGNSASDGSGCFLDWAVGLLSVDPTSGTTVKDEGTGQVMPIMWKPGYTARRVGSEVSVLDPNGTVVATTGHRYKINGGWVGPGDPAKFPTVSGFWACGRVDPVP